VTAAADEPCAARAFALVWTTLVGVLGTAATATMLRRAARAATRKRPDLEDLQGFEIVRERLEYRVVLPPSWNGGCDGCLEALGYLLREELCPLLEELTGPVVVSLLRRQPDLQRHGIFPDSGDHA
jgi:hypothetical protein